MKADKLLIREKWPVLPIIWKKINVDLTTLKTNFTLEIGSSILGGAYKLYLANVFLI